MHVQTRTSHSKMNLERIIDSKLISMNERSSDSTIYSRKSTNYYAQKLKLAQQARRDLARRKSSTLLRTHCTGSSSNSPGCLFQYDSRSESSESVYYDAPNEIMSATNKPPEVDAGSKASNGERQLLISKSLPVAQKIIDIVHYSITGDSNCSNSTTNLIARLLVGTMIER